MEITWLRKALKNLDEEAEYIAKDHPQAARIIVLSITNAVSMLADNPALGRAGRLPGTRELVIPDTRYLVPYRVRPRLEHLRC